MALQLFDHKFVAMGGPCRIQVYTHSGTAAEAALASAEAEIRRLEHKYSRYLPNSLTSQINSAAGGGETIPIDSETAGLLEYADTLWQQSDGLFDLTSGILRRAWDFKSNRLPEQAVIDNLLPGVGWRQVEWSAQHVYLPRRGMELDFGGIVKEYGCDSALRRLRAEGVAHGLVELAGDIAVIGPRGDGQPWPIGIQHPADTDGALAWVPMTSGGLATSGDYRRCLEVGGKRYSHILNPRSGWPVEGLRAVSVIADQCLVAGSSASIAMLKPAGDALEWLSNLGLPWLAVDQGLGCHGSLSAAPLSPGISPAMT